MARTSLADVPSLESWPGSDVRSPTLRNYGYLVQRPLARLIRERVQALFGDRRDLHVLDLGCGKKPYYPLIAPYAARYVGSDYVPDEHVDVLASAEAIPFRSESFDLVLCSQVLEHVPEPSETLRAIADVLKPGGRVLLSTHGTYIYHPHPTDYWRWTQDGLQKIFADSGVYDEIALHPNGGTGSCLAYLGAAYAHLLLRRRPLRGLKKVVLAGLIPCINVSGLSLDRVLRPFDYPSPYSLVANFLVEARRRTE